MTKLLLSIHVLVAIVAIGPVTVAASMFPAATRRALAEPADPRNLAVLHNLHRICRVYATLGVLVPVFGLATASSLGVLGDAWLIISIILTVAAAAVLVFLVLPGQATALRSVPVPARVFADEAAGQSPGAAAGEEAEHSPGAAADGRVAARLGMVTGVFNLLWAVVVVLMIVRPGSTTGA
ncbi:hypothetical protein [Actinoplanes auranticolor]|uniref:Membrane protein n=1 Tax=Actinoplanes auranticolor TaxID=47988 RepID=A0A919SGU4_9ACTN|nr:hypothetical protein [Actinoplanes auranticolor]GIM72465.1 membrane protein [Actinoplanes auranticolor]